MMTASLLFAQLTFANVGEVSDPYTDDAAIEMVLTGELNEDGKLVGEQNCHSCNH